MASPMKCVRCKEVVEMSICPETGEEYYCKCQCTLDAEFNQNLWKENEMKIELMKGSLFFEFDKEGGEETKTDGGIIMPEQKDTYMRKVTIAGPNDVGIKAGDTVLLNPHVQLMEFRIGLKYYKLCPVSMVVAIIRD